MKAILLDIEGTTTDIKFVKDVLFPYARDNVESYLSALNDEEIQEILRSFTLNDVNTSEARDCRIQAIVTEVHRQIAEDKKTTELKSLQGKIWKIAFESGSIKGQANREIRLQLGLIGVFYRTCLRRCSKKSCKMGGQRNQNLHLLVRLCRSSKAVVRKLSSRQLAGIFQVNQFKAANSVPL